jgi:hypothetical protein
VKTDGLTDPTILTAADRDWHIRMARTFLHQAAVVRRQGIHHAWHARLLQWAANRRLRAVAKPEAPAQGELF